MIECGVFWSEECSGTMPEDSRGFEKRRRWPHFAIGDILQQRWVHRGDTKVNRERGRKRGRKGFQEEGGRIWGGGEDT